MGRILHHAMEEVLGKKRLSSILGSAEEGDESGQTAKTIGPIGAEYLEDGHFSPAKLRGILGSLELHYGAPAGKGLALRIGRACFQYGLREYGEELGLTSTSFRLLPFPAKLSKFAEALAGLFNTGHDRPVHVERRDGRLLWRMQQCPFCEQGRAQEPVCALPVGLAEESLYWLSGGKIFSVEEIGCIAKGDPACTLKVDETPLS